MLHNNVSAIVYTPNETNLKGKTVFTQYTVSHNILFEI